MKKAVLAVTALFATVTAAPALAAEFSYGGFMRYRGIFLDPGTANGVWGGAPEETNDIFEYRVRQFFNLKVNDHVTTNVKFEWNSQFGDERQYGGGSGDLQFGNANPQELQFRVKNAFVRFDLPGIPVTLTVGQQDFSTPKAIISVEDGTGVKADVKLDPVNFTLFWQKNLNGGNNATGVDDANWFGIVPSFKAGDITIAPHVSYTKAGDGAGILPGTEVWFLGVDSTGKVGPVGFTFDFIYQTGETGVNGAYDVSLFILDASASLAAGPGTLTAKVIYSPGDDSADDEVESWLNVIATDLGWSPFFHDGTSISGFAGTVLPAPAGAGNAINPLLAGATGINGRTGVGGIFALGLEYAFSPYKNLTVTPNVYYLMANEDVNLANGGPNRVDDLYGIEAGVQANWRLWDSVVILAQFDYLFAGDVFENAAGDTKDAWRFVIGPSISW